MEEESRDLYNRFGQNVAASLSDPRKDDVKLIGDISANYLLWAVLVFVVTSASRSCRNARVVLTVVGLLIAAVEVCFTVVDASLPTWVDYPVSERDVIEGLHIVYPCIIALWSFLSAYWYEDVEDLCTAALSEACVMQQVCFVCVYQVLLM